jgi:hypothetical protein
MPVTVTPGAEKVLTGSCTLTDYVCSKHGNLRDLNLENLATIIWIFQIQLQLDPRFLSKSKIYFYATSQPS